MSGDFIERPLKNEKDEAVQYVRTLLERAREDSCSEDISRLEEVINLLQTKKYGLVWEEHAEIVEEEMKTKIPVFVEDETKKIVENLDSKNYNFLLEGDNLHSLHLLEKTHAGRIDVIYIDPPYNTGNKDFIYNDRFIDKTDGYRHSKWVSFINKRLEIARELLSDTGVILISIDDNEQAQLKLICDEVFGEENFIACITRNTNSSKNQSLYISVSHEYCLVYSKNAVALAEKHKDNKWAVDKNNIEEYQKKVSQLKKAGLSLEEITSELKELTKYPRFIDFTNYWYFDDYGLYRKDNLGGVKNGNMTPLYNPLTGKMDPIPPGGFRYKPEKLAELVKEKRIHFHTDGSLPTIKRYLSENSKQRPKSIMSDDQRPDYKLLKDLRISFDNPKQMTFMHRILSVFDKDSTILDFFAGSGTTGHAVAQLNQEDGGNRKYILCTNNENNICEEVTYKRLTSIQKELPHNLKYFKTDFVVKEEFPDFQLEDELLNYITPLVELEFGIDISNPSVQIILTEEHLGDLIKDNKLERDSTIFIHPGVFLDSREETLLSELNISLQEIPNYYFGKDLWV